MDKIDKKLIYELDANARQNLNRIAKKLRISRNVAEYRLNRLKKDGVITGTYTEINGLALGFVGYRLLFNTSCASLQQIQELELFVNSQENLTWFSEVSGKWEYDLVYGAKSPVEFEKFYTAFFQKFNHIVNEKHISVLSQMEHFPRDYLLDKPRGSLQPKKVEFDVKNLTALDYDILQLLAHDANISILEIARKTKLSINTVKARIRKMENNKIILGYRLLLDTHKLGYEYFKLHVNFKNYVESDIKRIKEYIRSQNFVIYTDTYIGGDDLEIELHLKSERQYLEFLKELKKTFGGIINNHFLLKFHKVHVFRYLPKLSNPEL